jgi:hypothetical protein
MLRIIAVAAVLACSFMLGSGAYAQDPDRTRDKTVLHEPDQDKLKTQDKLHTQDKDATKDMIKDKDMTRDRDMLHTPGSAGTGKGSRAGAGGGRR